MKKNEILLRAYHKLELLTKRRERATSTIHSFEVKRKRIDIQINGIRSTIRQKFGVEIEEAVSRNNEDGSTKYQVII